MQVPWTLDERGKVIRQIRERQEGSIHVDADSCIVDGFFASSFSAEITISGDSVLISHVTGGGVITFESGTENGDTAAIAGEIQVEDQGDNL